MATAAVPHRPGDMGHCLPWYRNTTPAGAGGRPPTVHHTASTAALRSTRRPHRVRWHASRRKAQLPGGHTFQCATGPPHSTHGTLERPHGDNRRCISLASRLWARVRKIATNTKGELVFALHATRRQGQCKSCDDRRTREFTILCHYFTHITSSGDLARTPLFRLREIFQPQ